MKRYVAAFLLVFSISSFFSGRSLGATLSPVYVNCNTDTLGPPARISGQTGDTLDVIVTGDCADYRESQGYSSVATSVPAFGTTLNNTTSTITLATAGTGLVYVYDRRSPYPTRGKSFFLDVTAGGPYLSLLNPTISYTGAPVAANVTCSTGGAVSNVKYNGSLAIPVGVGIYTITGDCAANGSSPALVNASAGSFQILPIAPSLDVVYRKTNYDGTPQPANVRCSSGGIVSNIKYNGSNTPPTNVGLYSVTANCSAIGNYSELMDGSAGSYEIVEPRYVRLSGGLYYASPPLDMIYFYVENDYYTIGMERAYNVYNAYPKAGTSVLAAVLSERTECWAIYVENIQSDVVKNILCSVQALKVYSNGVRIKGGQTGITPPGPIPNLATRSITSQAEIIEPNFPNYPITYTASCTSSDGGNPDSGSVSSDNWNAGVDIPLSLTQGKTYTCTGHASAAGYTAEPYTVGPLIPPPAPTPSPAPIPTLSEWAEIMMMFLMILAVGWYGRRLKQR